MESEKVGEKEEKAKGNEGGVEKEEGKGENIEETEEQEGEENTYIYAQDDR